MIINDKKPIYKAYFGDTQIITNVGSEGTGGGGVLETINITENGVYVPSDGVDGYNEVNVNVTTPIETYILPVGIKFRDSTFEEIPTNWDYRNITDMSYMFESCKNISTIPSFVNCQNVTDMSYMFQNATFIGTFGSKINLFDTSSVTNMKYMFSNTRCDNLPLLDTSNVTNMSGMFNSCSYMQSIPEFNTINVTNMSSMFQNCKSLNTIPLLNTSNVTDMNNMFYNSNIKYIPLLDTSNVSNMSYMFQNCKLLTTIPLLNTGEVTNMNGMFFGCSSLQSIPLLNVNNVTSISTFFGSSNITTLTDLGGFKNLKINWNDVYGLNKLPNLTYESVMNVINNLYDFPINGSTETRTIKFNANSIALLSDADIAIATNKGWTIS